MGRTGRIGWQDARIGDRYRLVEKLGTGGMSVVWRGFDEILGRQVAIKVLSPELAGDAAFRDRLRQEALSAARLCHPHITGIFDFGESPLSPDVTVPYVVMELNDGESVATRLHRQGPMPWRQAVTIAAEVASALATAHAEGVVHRDVTPANVMLTGAGAKVVDFGISALVGQCDAAPDGSLLGTPAYLAPERLGGVQVTTATDVYALGLLLYRCLTARLPWPADNTTEALRAHLYADPQPLPPLAGLPPEVASLCMTCLAKDPADRPVAEHVANVLATALGQRLALPPPVARTLASVSPLPQRRRSALRLRLGLKVASALHVGVVRPLGDGLFAGGRLGRDVLRTFSVRHRVPAAVATLTLLTVVGLSVSATSDPPDAGPAQAAAAGPHAIAGVLHSTGCKVRYQVRRDSGQDFAARLTLINTGSRAITGWRLEFVYPGAQRLATTDRTLTQRGRKIIVRGRPDKAIAAGRSVTMILRGGYRATNPLPLNFVLNGHPCDAEVIGATTVTAADDAVDSPPSRPVTEAAGARRSAADPGSGGGAGRRDDQVRNKQKAKPAKAKHRRTPVKPTAPAPAAPPVPSVPKSLGFSVSA
jgi:eukaryotic-like serine/threonine-protein kinase